MGLFDEPRTRSYFSATQVSNVRSIPDTPEIDYTNRTLSMERARPGAGRNSLGAMDALGVVNEYVSQRKSTLRTINQIAVHEQLQPQLAPGQDVYVRIMYDDAGNVTNITVDDPDSSRSYLLGSRTEVDSFLVKGPPDYRGCLIGDKNLNKEFDITIGGKTHKETIAPRTVPPQEKSKPKGTGEHGGGAGRYGGGTPHAGVDKGRMDGIRGGGDPRHDGPTMDA